MANTQEQPLLSEPSSGAADAMMQGGGVAQGDGSGPSSTIAADGAPEKQTPGPGELSGDNSPRMHTSLDMLLIKGPSFGLGALPAPSSFGAVASGDVANGTISSSVPCWVTAKRAHSPDQETQEPNKRQHLQPEAGEGSFPAPAYALDVPASPALNPAVESLLADLEEAINKQKSSSPVAMASSVHPARAAMLAAAEAEVQVPWNKIGADEEGFNISGANQLPLGASDIPQDPTNMVSSSMTRKQPHQARLGGLWAGSPTARNPAQRKVPARARVPKEKIAEYKSSGKMREYILEAVAKGMGWGGFKDLDRAGTGKAAQTMVDEMLQAVEQIDHERLAGGGPLIDAYVDSQSKRAMRANILQALTKGMGWLEVSGLARSVAWKATKCTMENLLFNMENLERKRCSGGGSLTEDRADARFLGSLGSMDDAGVADNPAPGENQSRGSQVVVTEDTPIKTELATPASKKLVQRAVARVQGDHVVATSDPQPRRDSGIGGIIGGEGPRTTRVADLRPPMANDVGSYRPQRTESALRNTHGRDRAAIETNDHFLPAVTQPERRDSYRSLSVASCHADNQMSTVSSRAGVQASPYFATASQSSPSSRFITHRHPAFDDLVQPDQPRPNGLPLAEYARSHPSAYGHRSALEPASHEQRARVIAEPAGHVTEYHRAPRLPANERDARRIAEPVGTYHGYHDAPRPAASERGARWVADMAGNPMQYPGLIAASRHAPEPAPNERGARRFLEAATAFDQSSQIRQTTTIHDYQDYMSRVKRGGNYSFAKPEGRMFLDYD